MNGQILNISYGMPYYPEYFNKILHNLFYSGIIQGTFTFSNTSVTVSDLSFLIHPENKSDIIVRIDTMKSFTKTKNSPTDNILIARYRWENANKGAEFLFIESSMKLDNDIILIGLNLDSVGNIIELNYDVQDIARIKLIDINTSFPHIKTLDGYEIGNEDGKIPLKNVILNKNLNSQYLNGKELDQFIVSKQLPTIEETNGLDTITYSTIPSWMNSEAVDSGEGVTSEFLNNQKVQPQDGSTIPGNNNQIPIANTILQKNLNIQYLNGAKDDTLSKLTHGHNLDDITDGGSPSLPDYYKIIGVKNNLISSDSIKDNDIGYEKISKYAYDATMNINYTPIFETGTVTLTGVSAGTITFSRNIRNARIFLQPIYSGATAGYEKRTCRIYSVTTTSASVKQMGSILLSGSNYIRNDAGDTGSRVYSYLIIGEAM